MNLIDVVPRTKLGRFYLEKEFEDLQDAYDFISDYFDTELDWDVHLTRSYELAEKGIEGLEPKDAFVQLIINELNLENDALVKDMEYDEPKFPESKAFYETDFQNVDDVSEEASRFISLKDAAFEENRIYDSDLTPDQYVDALVILLTKKIDEAIEKAGGSGRVLDDFADNLLSKDGETGE